MPPPFHRRFNHIDRVPSSRIFNDVTYRRLVQRQERDFYAQPNVRELESRWARISGSPEPIDRLQLVSWMDSARVVTRTLNEDFQTHAVARPSASDTTAVMNQWVEKQMRTKAETDFRWAYESRIKRRAHTQPPDTYNPVYDRLDGATWEIPYNRM